MTKLSNFLRSAQDNNLLYWCQGCGHEHRIQYGEGTGPRWTWDGNVDKPTFSPSVLVTGINQDMDDATQAAYDEFVSKPGGTYAALADPRFRTVCHTFIVAGMVQFLGDCTHEFAGQTLPLPELPGD